MRIVQKTHRLSNHAFSGERGFIVPIIVTSIIVMLTLISFALDLGYYYRRRVQAQKAADAATLGAMGYALTQENLPPDVESLIEEKALELVTQNMLLGGFDPAAATITPDYVPATGLLSVDISFSTNMLFGFIARHLSIEATVSAEAKRNDANIVLVLDYSRSMACPTSGACTCLTPSRTDECEDLGVTLKIDDLRSSVTSFLNMFDTNRDRIGLVLFNIAGESVVPINNENMYGFNKQALIDALEDNDPISSTNVTDGIFRAIKDFNDSGLLDDKEVTMVVFGDGAPTGATILAGNPSQLSLNNPYGRGSYDYIHYTVQWDGYQGPGLLTRSEFIPRDYNSSKPPSGVAGEYVPACSPYLDEPPSVSSQFDSVFSTCLNNLGFLMPYQSGPVYGGDCGAGGINFTDCYRKMYFHSAIEGANEVRRRDGMVYVIGLGPPGDLSNAISNGDPFQDIEEVHLRKDIFGTRLAGDYIEAVPLSAELYLAQHPEFSYGNSSTYANLRESMPFRVGRYFATPASSELRRVFSTVARRILLRLSR